MSNSFYSGLSTVLSNISSGTFESVLNNVICDVQYLSLLCEECRQPQKYNDKPGYEHVVISFCCSGHIID